jgi:LuxR family transcriptional regulator, maltose regulon positive regulatory protein
MERSVQDRPPITRVNRTIRRARLFDRLDRDWPTPLLAVTAPAGFGKTTTIEAWLGERDARVLWIGLGEDDNDPILLWTRILAEAMREVGVGARAGGALGGPLGSPRPAIGLFAAELRATGTELILVLDDLHLIDDPACLRSIEIGVELLASNVSWVILSRREPDLPLERLHGRGQLARIGPAELAFDREETADLLRRFDLGLSAAERDSVHDATGGWPAAVYMSALWLRDAEDPGAAARGMEPGAADDALTDYLLREVVGGLEPKLRTFLRRSAVLRRINGRLCDEVLERAGSAELIEQLRDISLLIRGERAHRGWYRYHALLRQALLAELEEAEPGAAAVLGRRAAAWFLREGMPEDAAEQAREAGDHKMLTELLAARYIDLVRTGRSTTLLRWAEALPPEVMEARPDVTIAIALAAEVAARPSIEIRRLLARAELARERQDPAWTAESEIAFHLLSAGTGEAGVGAAVGSARAAIAAAEEGEPDLVNVGAATLGMFLELAGEDDEAEASAREVVESPTVERHPFALLMAKGTLALVELRRGRPHLARFHLERAAKTIARAAIEEGPIAARIYACEALLAIAEGDAAEARRASERSLVHPFDTAPLLAWTLLVAAEARAFGGDFAGAREALAHAGELLERSPDPGRLAALHEEVAARVAASEADGGILAEPISPAELRVLRLLAEDMTRTEIARTLVVSPNTVKTHQRSLYRKLGAGDRETAVGRARSHGLLDGAPEEGDSPG